MFSPIPCDQVLEWKHRSHFKLFQNVTSTFSSGLIFACVKMWDPSQLQPCGPRFNLPSQSTIITPGTFMFCNQQIGLSMSRIFQICNSNRTKIWRSNWTGYWKCGKRKATGSSKEIYQIHIAWHDCGIFWLRFLCFFHLGQAGVGRERYCHNRSIQWDAICLSIRLKSLEHFYALRKSAQRAHTWTFASTSIASTLLPASVHSSTRNDWRFGSSRVDLQDWLAIQEAPICGLLFAPVRYFFQFWDCHLHARTRLYCVPFAEQPRSQWLHNVPTIPRFNKIRKWCSHKGP